MPVLPTLHLRSSADDGGTLLRRANNDHGSYAKPRSFSPGVLFVFCLLAASLALLAWWLFIRRGGFFWKPWDWEDYKASILRKPERRPPDALTIFSDGSVRRAGSSVAGSCVGPARTVVLGELDTTYQKSMVIRNEKGYEETRAERRARRKALRAQRAAERDGGGSAWGGTVTRSLWGRLRGGNADHRDRNAEIDSDDDTYLQREKSLAKARGRYLDNDNGNTNSDLGYTDGFSYVDDEPAARPLQSVAGHSEIPSQPLSAPFGQYDPGPSISHAAVARMSSYARGDDQAAPVSRMQSFARGDDAPAALDIARKKTYSRHMDAAKSRSTRDETKRPRGARPPTTKIKQRERSSSRNQRSSSRDHRSSSTNHRSSSTNHRSSSRDHRSSSTNHRSRSRGHRSSSRDKRKSVTAGTERHRRESKQHRSTKQPSSRQQAGHRYVAAPVAEPEEADITAQKRPAHRSSRHQKAVAAASARAQDPDPDIDSTPSSSSEESSDEESELNPSEIGMAKGNKVYKHTLNRDDIFWGAGRPAERNGGGAGGSAYSGSNLGKGYRRGSAGSLSSEGSVGSSNAGR